MFIIFYPPPSCRKKSVHFFSISQPNQPLFIFFFLYLYSIAFLCFRFIPSVSLSLSLSLTHTHTQIHTKTQMHYICTHTHTHTHTNTHTHTQTNKNTLYMHTHTYTHTLYKSTICWPCQRHNGWKDPLPTLGLFDKRQSVFCAQLEQETYQWRNKNVNR